MIDYTLDPVHSILYLRPKAALEQADFVQLAKTLDPHIEASGGLRGLIIEAPAFPGWDSLGAMAAHLRFVREHHKRIGKIALVTDSALGNVAEQLASHFVVAKIRHFAARDAEAARQWVTGNARSAPAGAVIYAKDLARLSDFYLQTLGMRRLHSDPEHQVIESDDIQLVMHAIPEHIASTFSISSPPLVREEQAIKLFFTVPSIAGAAAVAASLGGAVFGQESPGLGFRMRNGYDPEGNVFQLRERIADAA